MKGSQKSQLQEYFIIKKSVQLPAKLKIYFNLLQASIQNGQQISCNQKDAQGFMTAFCKMSIQEKAHFMNENIKFVVKVLFQKNNQDNIDALMNPIQSLMNIQTTADISTTKMKIPCWASIKFKLDKKQRQITVSNHKKSTFISLQKYLARKSKKFKGAIILDLATEPTKNDIKKYTFYFQPSVAQSFFQEITAVVISYRNQMLYQMLNTSPSDSATGQNPMSNTKAFVLLSSKNINNYLNSKQKFLKYLLTSKFDFKTLLNEQVNNLRIDQSKNNEKIFKMECVYKMPATDIKQRFLNSFDTNNRYIMSSEVLENFSKGRYRAMYEKYMIEGKSQELISIKEAIYPKDKLQSDEMFLFIMGIENIMVKNFLQFFMAKARAVNAEESKIIIICSINLNLLITSQVVKQFLRELSETIIRSHQQTVQIQEEFYTVYGNSFNSEETVEFVEADEEYKGQLNIEMIKKEQESQVFGDKCLHLSKKFRLEPLSITEYNPREHLMKQHYLFKEWARAKDGGVICTNEAIINEQKKMFKHILTTFGNNILKGNSILNISLPVNIFKKQSHLYSIARDFCYAPLLLQNVTHPLERIKRISVFAISIGTLGISMDKPFNPILGQTLQVWIGGCPMYLEQISHHPPIGAYLFYGRGYKIHGQIQPKISFGMNNVKGYSQRPNYIIFDDGTQIELVFGRMVINGMLFGERMFDFSDKIYVYDKKNHFFSQIFYGPRKKNMIMKNSDPKDYVYGKVFKVKPQFRKKFQEQRPNAYPTKQHIIQELSEFEGFWTETIKFEKRPEINFKTQLPCVIQEQPYPLPSNSHFRKDLANLAADDIEEAQRQKQIMEELQRRDRKLREKYRMDKRGG